MHAKTRKFYILTVRAITCDKASTRRLTTAILHGTSPRGDQGSADLVAKVQMEKSRKMIEKIGPEKSQQKG